MQDDASSSGTDMSICRSEALFSSYKVNIELFSSYEVSIDYYETVNIKLFSSYKVFIDAHNLIRL